MELQTICVHYLTPTYAPVSFRHCSFMVHIYSKFRFLRFSTLPSLSGSVFSFLVSRPIIVLLLLLHSLPSSLPLSSSLSSFTHSLMWCPSRVADTPPLLHISRYDHCLFVADVCLCSEALQPGGYWSYSWSSSIFIIFFYSVHAPIYHSQLLEICL